MLSALRDAIIEKFGDNGRMWTFTTDFELAAVNAIHDVFPWNHNQGMYVPFQTGTEGTYSERGTEVRVLFQHQVSINQSIYLLKLGRITRETEQNEQDSKWLWLIMAPTMLPVFVTAPAWNDLKTLPLTGQSHVYSKILAFAVYFKSTCISGDLAPVTWSHYDSTGPRTTNLAEGYHNGLNSWFGTVPRCWLQKLANRYTQLDLIRPLTWHGTPFCLTRWHSPTSKTKYTTD